MIPPNDPNIGNLGKIKKTDRSDLHEEKESQAIESVFAARPTLPYMYSFFDTSSIYIKERNPSGAQPIPTPSQGYAVEGYYQEGYVL
jgi:hypothetical protein